MRTNLIRAISIIMLASLLVCAIYSEVFGGGGKTIKFGDVNSVDMTKEAKDDTGTAKTFKTVLQSVLTVTQVIGVGVAIIMLIVLAIKYISAAPNDKAEIKKHMVVYVVGAVVLFAASGILQIIKTFAKIFNDNTGAES